MNLSETSILLAAIASRDQRTVGKADVESWQMDLWDVPIRDALQAISIHNRQTRERITAFDIITIVKKMREKRLEGVERIQPPAHIADGTVAEYRQWVRDIRAQVAAGEIEVPPELPAKPIQVKAIGRRMP